LRNFWDGRAQDVFNGVNPFGLRDRGAQVYVSQGPQQVRAIAIEIDNASLASQAVGPPLSAFEMSAAGKQFPDLGRRLLGERPLADQMVHSDDSVLGSLSRGNMPGLSIPDYATLIRQAFKPQWWESEAEITLDAADGDAGGTAHANSSPALAAAIKPHAGNKPTGPTYSQMEANFSLFFGLSVQLYESLLVSDQTPYDSYAEGNTGALTTTQKLGLDVFLNKGKCVNCHKNAEFTGATVQNALNQRVERMLMGDGQLAIYDNGFYNIGVRPTREDLGVGGGDPFGLPLSEARLLSQSGAAFFEQVIGSGPGLSPTAGERATASGAFKTPGLRNIELTAPYFHNGGQRTLAEVVDFYNRGGDFARQNIADLDADIQPLGLTVKEKDALVQFLKALTDERVRSRKAPFDHPQLWLPNGHVGGTGGVTNNGFDEAVDQMLEIPATGRNGGTPLKNFLE
ncbi:MAG: cytochrome-c peroxidase, partial [Planctomycetaceae bacterium]